MVAIQEMERYGRLSGVRLGTTDIVQLAHAFGAKGLRIESPDGISSLKIALAMLSPELVGVPADFLDDHCLIEIVHPEALN